MASTTTPTTTGGSTPPATMTPSDAVMAVVHAVDDVPALEVRSKAGLGRLAERVLANAGAVRAALDAVRSLALAVMDAIVVSATDRAGIRADLTTLQLQVGIIGTGLADERTARANGDTSQTAATAAVAAQIAGEAAARTSADTALAARMTPAEQAIVDERVARIGADDVERAARIAADAAEAAARANGDSTEAAARAAADAAEASRAQAAENAEAVRAATAEAALATRVSALETRTPTLASGRALANGGNAVVLLAGATVTIAVTFDAPASTASYLAMPVLDTASALFTSLKVDSVTNRTTTGCSVVVRSTATVSITGQIAVTVLALKV